MLPVDSVEHDKCLISRRGEVGAPLYVLDNKDWIEKAMALLLNITDTGPNNTPNC